MLGTWATQSAPAFIAHQRFASSDLRGDSDLTLEAVAQCGRAFKFCSTKLQRDRGFVLKAVKANGHVLKYVDEAREGMEKNSFGKVEAVCTALDAASSTGTLFRNCRTRR